jgi:hypothetical protein
MPIRGYIPDFQIFDGLSGLAKIHDLEICPDHAVDLGLAKKLSGLGIQHFFFLVNSTDLITARYRDCRHQADTNTRKTTPQRHPPRRGIVYSHFLFPSYELCSNFSQIL